MSVLGLPRTNNDLEHCFGVARVHERRATGRRGAIPGVVVRGSVRVIAAVVTREKSFSAEELRPAIISGGTNSAYMCSNVRKPVGSNSVSVKILLPIWRLWKLNYSREVCHSAGFLLSLRFPPSPPTLCAHSRLNPLFHGGVFHTPASILPGQSPRLILGHSHFKEVLLFSEINNLTHP